MNSYTFFRKIFVALFIVACISNFLQAESESKNQKLERYRSRAEEIYNDMAQRLEGEQFEDVSYQIKESILELAAESREAALECINFIASKNNNKFDQDELTYIGEHMVICCKIVHVLDNTQIDSKDISYALHKVVYYGFKEYFKLFAYLGHFYNDDYVFDENPAPNFASDRIEDEALENAIKELSRVPKTISSNVKAYINTCADFCDMHRNEFQEVDNDKPIQNTFDEQEDICDDSHTLVQQKLDDQGRPTGEIQVKKLKTIEEPFNIYTKQPVTIYVDSVAGQTENSSLGSDPEAHFFIPKVFKSLNPEEKEVDVLERISKKYIGKIPSQVEDVVNYFNNYEECVRNNISIHNKLLLHGKPGTGKSHLIKVIAEELELPMLSFTASFFGDKYIGESSRRIRRAFSVARDFNKPIIVFIDEIDGLAAKRKQETNIEQRATLLTLLTEIQDIQNYQNIFVFAATNDLKVLDTAIKDRFAGALCEIKELSVKERTLLFKKFFADKGVNINTHLARRLAEVTKSGIFVEDKDRFTNRDIEYIVTTALLKAFVTYKKNPQQCKHLCAYVRATIDAMKKKGRFAWLLSTYH